MAKVSAEQFSREGDKYLGRSYSEMDCQEFVERAMRDAGLNMNLAGSNAWLREVMKNGWVGSPEECKAKFGCVPTGALLFIHAFDGKEPEKYKKDGIGNASHIGFVTHRNDGAIHSSASRGMVCTSKFADKTIKNGGWNKIGLYNKFTYNEAVDRILNGGEATPAGEDTDTQEDEEMYTAILEGGNAGKPINIRKKPDGDLQDQLPQGTKVTVLDESGNWCKIEYKKGSRSVTGYVKGDFVVVDDEAPADESDIPSEDFDDDDDWGNETVNITLSMTAREAAYALPVLEKLVDAIVDKVGRG